VIELGGSIVVATSERSVELGVELGEAVPATGPGWTSIAVGPDEFSRCRPSD
jgi:hypothetical protein